MAVDPLQLEHWYGPLAAKLMAEKAVALDERSDLVSALQRMAEIEAPIKKLLSYSFDPIHWKWEDLTVGEKKIIPSQGEFDKLRAWVKSE